MNRTSIERNLVKVNIESNDDTTWRELVTIFYDCLIEHGYIIKSEDKEMFYRLMGD